MRHVVRTTTLAIGAACLAGCSVFGIRSGTEQPAYEVVGTISEEVEVRRYGTRTAAQVVLDRGDPEASDNGAFRILAGYIFGGNQGERSIDMTAPVAITDGEEIAMTAPVETRQGAGDGYAMRFFLPAAYSVDTAPMPNDPRVEIVEMPPTTLAVVRFSGRGGDEAAAERGDALIAALDQSPWRPIGSPVAMYYDPPWTLPFLRRNEVAVEVAPR